MRYYEVIAFKFHVDCFSQTEPTTGSICLKKLTSCESAPAENLEIGVFAATQRALTFPVPTSTYSIATITLCFVPSARGFYE
jgi:hypothetical protein